MGLREEKKSRTRFQLLEAAVELFSRQGFDQTTLDEIAAVVQVSPRTLLRYFPTKEDVIVSWVDDGMAILRDSLDARPSSESGSAALLAAARQMLSAYDARGKFFLVIERVIASSPQVAARKQQMMDSLARDLNAILLRRSGNKAPCSPFSCDVYTGTVFAIIQTATRTWAAGNGRRSLVELFDEAASCVRFVEPVAKQSDVSLQ